MVIKPFLSGPDLVYPLGAGQTVWNRVARPHLIEANKDKKRERDQEDREQ
jgi:hypothetical protein